MAAPTKLKRAGGMYFLKTGSPAHLRWLKILSR
jgi:hypothetical protein